MSLSPRRFVVILFLLVLLPVVLLFRSRPDRQAFELLVNRVDRFTNGTVCVTVLLTNSGTRMLNIGDDSSGQPAFILDYGADFGTWVTDTANRLTLYLKPGDSLTNTVTITNAPPRFRLKVHVRDLASERREGLIRFLTFGAVRPTRSYPEPPASTWIEDPRRRRE